MKWKDKEIVIQLEHNSDLLNCGCTTCVRMTKRERSLNLLLNKHEEQA